MPSSRPEPAALAAVPGEGPIALTPLDSGLVNDTWQVEREGRRYALRQSRAEGADLGLDRAWECRVLACAAAAGLGPELVHCDPAREILLTGWVCGVAVDSGEARSPVNARAVAALLRRVHALPVPPRPRAMNPRSWIGFYRAAERRRGLAPCVPPALEAQAERCLEELDVLALAPAPAVLCHGDVHPLNLAVGERLVLLDWEYAHVAAPLWDVAGWICNLDGDAAYADGFLAQYLGRDARPAERRQLALLCWLYDYVCLLWSGVYLRRMGPDAPGCAADAAVAGRAVRLRERLLPES